jgi:hypothetical protein
MLESEQDGKLPLNTHHQPRSVTTLDGCTVAGVVLRQIGDCRLHTRHTNSTVCHKLDCLDQTNLRKLDSQEEDYCSNKLSVHCVKILLLERKHPSPLPYPVSCHCDSLRTRKRLVAVNVW